MMWVLINIGSPSNSNEYPHHMFIQRNINCMFYPYHIFYREILTTVQSSNFARPQTLRITHVNEITNRM